jgi:hypothetical protein
MMADGGVSSPKRGRSSGGDSNSDGGSGIERGCAHAAGEEENGGKERGRGCDGQRAL